MSGLEKFHVMERQNVRKDVVYRNEDPLKNDAWEVIFCYDTGLPQESYLRTHMHTHMKEGFVVSKGELTVQIESPDGETSEITRKEGEYCMVDEQIWHTLINTTNDTIEFYALGITNDRNGQTIDRPDTAATIA